MSDSEYEDSMSVNEECDDVNNRSVAAEAESESESRSNSDPDSDSDSDSESADMDEIEEIVHSIDDEKAVQLWNDRSNPDWFYNICFYLKARTTLACELASFSSDFLGRTLGEEFKKYGY